MKSSKRKISLAVALVLSALGASAAQAVQPSLLGGGSTLVQPSIGTEISMFGDGPVSYFGVGSGAGQTAFLTNSAASFGAGVTGTVDFANSDAPLTIPQITGYTRAGTDGPLIQIPFIVTPITIPLVNAPTGTGPLLPPPATNPTAPGDTIPTVALNDDDLCGIFSGKLTNWNQVINPDNNSAYTTNAPITVVYRSDSSGTTDLLTAHLHQVCNTTNTATSVTFNETQHFAGTSAVPVADAIFPNGAPTPNFIGVSGSGAVAAQLVSFKTTSTAAVSYLSPDFTNTFLAPSSTPAQINQLRVASLRNPSTNADVVPTFGNATLAIGTVKLPTPTNAADQSQWVPNASNPAVGYPISGTSQIILSQCYANTGSTPTVTAAVVDFLNLHYNSNAGILNGNGFDVVPSALKNLIVTDFLTAGRTNTLNIGNTAVCGKVAGR
ncbi:MAG TPA: substrate-binding domain-containing protein [Paraburkholderia sp.]|jgi:ABC-type phosphate transport system substrate-binding protein